MLAMLMAVALTGQPKVGDVVYCETGEPDVPVAMVRSEVAYLRFHRAIMSGDDDGLEELENEDQLVYLAPRVKVRVLFYRGRKSDLPRVQFRVLEGPHKGEKGWTTPTFFDDDD